ncbi:hypothetical protein L2E82_20287 [Cichorium intybus]|uniref:Uncharacterized protein n=1 Tax=Cichorium intybus TaxID=13427 RepID=A0ACB9DT87_CICIN|nr:hypothetical protein L2E82_20287 [Cichorium intybus]
MCKTGLLTVNEIRLQTHFIIHVTVEFWIIEVQSGVGEIHQQLLINTIPCLNLSHIPKSVATPSSLHITYFTQIAHTVLTHISHPLFSHDTQITLVSLG